MEAAAKPPQGHTARVKIAGTECTFETGRIAKLASAAVVGRCGDDVVLATVVVGSSPRDVDFLPLTVEYREKFASVGRIPGNFQRREARISDAEVLMCRIIDRTIRSLFPKGYHHEVQLQVQVMSATPQSDLTSLALLSATAAIHLSEAPAKGPAAGLRILRHRDAWQAFGHRDHREAADVDFVLGAGPDGVVMVEGDGREISEELCVEAIQQAQSWLQRAQKAFDELRTAAGAPDKHAVPTPPALPELPDAVVEAARKVTTASDKAHRQRASSAARDLALELLPDEDPELVKTAVDKLRTKLVRDLILDSGRRLDGRKPDEIRPIWGEVGWLPRPHGSAVFTRGETQALVTCTLGTTEDAQMWDDLAGVHRERFLLHYNFPPYSVNEARPIRGPGRREIGHGALARRGLLRLLPSNDDFPYTLRIESEIAESNGSSSMATVCGGSMALMHAGVPLERPVAGIAMGLIHDGERTAVLSDILGDEDHLGDMDFKVVGTERGVTALQLDNKIGGLTGEQLANALQQAKAGREHILRAMASVIAEPRADLSPHAPRAQKIAIMPSAIGALVGPRGQNIKAIQSETGARVAIQDSGIVTVYAPEGRSADAALRRVQEAAGIVRVGKCYRATVTGVRDFGVFAKINEVNEGLVPIEELDAGRVGRPSDVVREGEEIHVCVIGTDDRGRLRLSRKRALGVDESELVF